MLFSPSLFFTIPAIAKVTASVNSFDARSFYENSTVNVFRDACN